MKELIEVVFPGLGIGPFTINKVIFSIGPIEVRWYGLLITLGILFAFWYTSFRGKRNEGVIFDDILDIGMVTVLCGVIGARAYYVLTTLNTHNYQSFYDVIAIWEGGIAIYGGIIGGCIGIVLACRYKKIYWRKFFDMVAPGVMMAQAIGRWGNFFNGEAHGYVIGDTTRFYLFNHEYRLPSGEGTFFHTFRMGLTDTVGGTMFYYHPTFLYECVWNLIGFVLINLFYKHKKFDGQVALCYFAWYGFGRTFVEGFRTDSLYIPGTTLRISQCLGLACFVVALGLMAVVLILQHRKPGFLCVATAAKYGTAAKVEPLVGNTEPTENNTDSETESDGKVEKSEEENNGDEN